jgi:hypothetical protein
MVVNFFFKIFKKFFNNNFRWLYNFFAQPFHSKMVGNRVLATGFWLLVAGLWLLVSGNWSLVPGCRLRLILDARYLILDTLITPP